MVVPLNGRLVAVDEVCYESDPVDCFITQAYYTDNGESLTEDELNELTNKTDLYELWLDHQIGIAESR